MGKDLYTEDVVRALMRFTFYTVLLSSGGIGIKHLPFTSLQTGEFHHSYPKMLRYVLLDGSNNRFLTICEHVSISTKDLTSVFTFFGCKFFSFGVGETRRINVER